MTSINSSLSSLKGPSNHIQGMPNDIMKLNKIQYFNQWTMNLKPFILSTRLTQGYTPFVLIFEVSVHHSKYQPLIEYLLLL